MSGGGGRIPFDTVDYVTTTGNLTTVEHGAFLLLAFAKWNMGELPDDDRQLAQIARLSLHRWRIIKKAVMGHLEWAKDRYWAPIQDRPPISDSDRAFVHQKYKYTCVYCSDKEGPFEIDHVEPWSRGGKHSVSNFALSCGPCNRAKGTKTLAEWGILK